MLANVGLVLIRVTDLAIAVLADYRRGFSCPECPSSYLTVSATLFTIYAVVAGIFLWLGWRWPKWQAADRLQRLGLALPPVILTYLGFGLLVMLGMSSVLAWLGVEPPEQIIALGDVVLFQVVPIGIELLLLLALVATVIQLVRTRQKPGAPKMQ
jgi:hypothetical protein